MTRLVSPACWRCGGVLDRKIEGVTQVSDFFRNSDFSDLDIYILNLPVRVCSKCGEYELEFRELLAFENRVRLFNEYVKGVGDVFCVHLPKFGWSVHSCIENARIALEKDLNPV